MIAIDLGTWIFLPHVKSEAQKHGQNAHINPLCSLLCISFP